MKKSDAVVLWFLYLCFNTFSIIMWDLLLAANNPDNKRLEC